MISVCCLACVERHVRVDEGVLGPELRAKRAGVSHRAFRPRGSFVHLQRQGQRPGNIKLSVNVKLADCSKHQWAWTSKLFQFHAARSTHAFLVGSALSCEFYDVWSHLPQVSHFMARQAVLAGWLRKGCTWKSKCPLASFSAPFRSLHANKT